ncbi:unnamed protein product [Colias eurytheme]|nr:unnamed protein product [Colias eurytheme]
MKDPPDRLNEGSGLGPGPSVASYVTLYSNDDNFDKDILDWEQEGEPTRRTHVNENLSAVDLTICTSDVASCSSWNPLPYTFGSDHFPILITLPFKNNQNYKQSSRFKYRLQNVDWDKYKNTIENEVRELPDVNITNGIKCSEAFAKTILQVAEELFPVKSTSNTLMSSPPWWDKDCTEAIKKRKLEEKRYAENMSTENYNNLIATIKTTRSLLKRKKQEGWKSFCTSISPNTCPSEVWKNLKRFRSAFAEQPYRFPESLARDFMKNIAPDTVPENNILPVTSVSFDHNYFRIDSFFSLYELKGVLSNVKDSTPGLDGIPYSFLKNLGDTALQYYLDIINNIMLSGNIPSVWKTQEIIPILKPHKPADEHLSYRPVALSCVLLKVAEHLVKNRLEWHIEHHDYLSNSQFGFRKAKSTIDSIGILTTDIRLAFSNNKYLVATFLDISSAYDNVIISILNQKLFKLNVPCILINFIISSLVDRTICLNLNESKNISRKVHKGLPQGSVLSPLLYNIYTYDLEKSLNDTVKILQYADDIVMYSVNNSLEEACNSLNSNLNILSMWLKDNGLDLSVEKSSVVVFSRKRSLPQVDVSYNGSIFPIKNEAKFLGVTLDSKLTGMPHIDFVSAKCERNLNIIRCLSGVWWGAHPFCLKLIYNALIRSSLDYGMFLLEGGNVSAFRKLDKIQAKAIRIVVGAMKSSPNNALQVECCDAPLHLRRQFLSDRFLFRALQFSNHPLFHKLKDLNEYILTSTYWRSKKVPCLIESFRRVTSITTRIYRSPRLSLFSHSYDNLLTYPDIKYDMGIIKNDPLANLNFNTEVNKEWKDWNLIFTDASKTSLSGCTGIGIYHTQYKIIQKIKLPPQASVFTGECLGILKAIDYILLAKLSRTVIFTDSKSSLQSLEKYPFNNKPFYPFIFEIRNKLTLCKNKNLTIVFAWIPSHTGIKGNEKADALAKDAIDSGDMFPYINYCHDLSNLPKVYLHDTWTKLWESSGMQKGKRFYSLQPRIPMKPWFNKTKGSKLATSIIIRMRLGHVCTPQHLTKIGVLDNEMCECTLDVGNLNHIFFACPLYDHSSLYLSLESLGVPFPISINCLLLNPAKYFEAINKFITRNNIKL